MDKCMHKIKYILAAVVDKDIAEVFMSSVAVKNKNSVIAVFKAVIIAIVVSLIAIIVQALFLKFFNMSEGLIPIVNQIIKGLSIFFGCIFSIRGLNNGWLKGLLVGIIYTVVGFTLFSVLYGDFSANLTLLNDIVLGSVTGLLSGVICANVGKSK